MLLDRVQRFASTRENFVRIGLMSDVPDQPVVGRIEGVVQGDRQFDGAEARGEVTAARTHGVDQEVTQFLCQRLQVTLSQSAQPGRRIDRFKQGVLGGPRHWRGV